MIKWYDYDYDKNTFIVDDVKNVKIKVYIYIYLFPVITYSFPPIFFCSTDNENVSYFSVRRIPISNEVAILLFEIIHIMKIKLQNINIF